MNNSINKASRNDWRSIDNPGKLFPATSNTKDTRVFRIYCELNEPVQKDILQMALERTMNTYPMFQSVLRKGVFWFYFENSELNPVVSQEQKPPCSSIYIRDKKTLLFQVTYWNNKINFETFHALTDGTGAIEFTKELTKNYILIAHAKDQLPDIALRDETATNNDYETDSFDKYFDKNSISSDKYNHKKDDASDVQSSNSNKIIKKKKTYQIKGRTRDPGEMRITEAVYSTQEILAKAREYQVSATVLLTAALMCAIDQERNIRSKRPIGIMIPVNLRNYMKSDTMMNFFGWISPQHDFSNDNNTFDDVVSSLKSSFSEQLTKENVLNNMNALVKIEKNPFLRGVPLELKVLSLKLAAFTACGGTTAVYSNVGAVKMPEEYTPYIKRFGFFVSTTKLQMCSCSFKDEFTVSFTSTLINENIERNFKRILKEIGLHDKNEQMDYPVCVKEPLKGLLFMKIISFLLIAATIGTMACNRVFSPHIHWSTYTVLGCLCTWIITMLCYFKRRNLMKNTVWQQIFVTIICMIWDYVTSWSGWSLCIAFPIINMVAVLSLFLITIIQHLKIRNYLSYYMITSVIGLIPYILVLTNAITFAILSVICSFICVLILIGLVIFRWKDVKQEMQKKFHV